MITPGAVTISDYLAAIRGGAQTGVRMAFTDQNILLESGDVDGEGGLQLLDIMNPDTDLVFGKAVAKELTVVLNRSAKTDRLRWTGEFRLDCGVMVNGDMAYVTLGYFHGKRPEKTLTDNINFVAYDRMTNFDKLADDFISSLTPEDFPMTLQDIYDGLCAYVGISNVAGDEIADIMGREFAELPFKATGVTCRDILAWIAEAVGCYAKITPDGDVVLKWFEDHQADMDIPLRGCFDMNVSEIAWLYDEDLRKKWQGLESDQWQELENVTWRTLEGEYSPYCADAIRMIQTEDDIGFRVPSSGVAHNLYTIVDNPFLYGETDADTEGYLTLLLERLKDLGVYYPTHALTIGNWLLEAGDIARVEYATGEYRPFPIFSTGFFWNGGHESTFESTGNLVREDVSLTNAQKLSLGGKFHIFRNDVNQLYSQIGDRSGKSTTLSQDVDSIQLIAEGKATIYRQGTDPTTDATIVVSVGDLWIDTSNNDKLWQWDGTQWVMSDIIDPANHTTQSLVRISPNAIQIVSGGTLDVDSVNFKLNSNDKTMTTGEMQYGVNGLWYKHTNPSSNNRYGFGIGANRNFSDCDDWALLYSQNEGSIGGNGGILFVMSPLSSPYDTQEGIKAQVDATDGALYIAPVWSNDDPDRTVRTVLGKSSIPFDAAYIKNLIGNAATATTATKLKPLNLATGATNMLVPSNSYHLLAVISSNTAYCWFGFIYCNGSGTVTRTQIGSGTGGSLTFSGGANRLEVTAGSTVWIAVLSICVGGNPMTLITS